MWGVSIAASQVPTGGPARGTRADGLDATFGPLRDAVRRSLLRECNHSVPWIQRRILSMTLLAKSCPLQGILVFSADKRLLLQNNDCDDTFTKAIPLGTLGIGIAVWHGSCPFSGRPCATVRRLRMA